MRQLKLSSRLGLAVCCLTLSILMMRTAGGPAAEAPPKSATSSAPPLTAPPLSDMLAAVMAGPEAADAAFQRFDRATQAPGRVAICFAPGTPEQYMKDVMQRVWGFDPDADFFTTSRWPGAANVPINLSWSLAPDTVFIPSGVGEPGAANNLFSSMDSKFASQGGRTRWVGLIQQAFDRWGALAGIRYTRIRFNNNDWDDGAAWGSGGSANLRGDVRIGSKNIDGGSGVLAYNNFPTGGDMVLDSSENWASSSNNWRFFRNVLTHEHGHGLGLLHSCPIANTKLMEPFLSTSFDGPQHDDIRGAHSLYGDNLEANDTTATATNLGTVTPGVPVTRGPTPAPNVNNGSIISIGTSTDVDFFRFTVGGPRTASVTVTPVGLTYDTSQQACSGQSGSCCSGNLVNSLAQANINVQFIAPNGTTVLGTGQSAAAGQPESLNNVLLNAAGTYFLRIFPLGGVSQPQLYHFTLTVANVDCNNNGIPDATDISNGTSQDCNADGIPDECQVPPLCPTCPDCQNDGIPDNCQVPPRCPSCPDCNGNGVPDSCEPDCNGNGIADACDINSSLSQDCQDDGIPDECQVPPLCPSCPDCNNNGIPDACDLSIGGDVDCNGNSIPDRCETDPSFCGGGCLADCDNDFIPDNCEMTAAFSEASGFAGPFDGANPRQFNVPSPKPSLGPVSLNFTARGDLAQPTQFVTVRLNGTIIGTIYTNGASNCPSIGDAASLSVSATQWNSLLSAGNNTMTVLMTPSAAVGPCGGSFIAVAVAHAYRVNDCNNNSVPDDCEIAAGNQNDCNFNFVPDSCEIASGQLADTNNNGRPDVCETPELVVFFVSPQAEVGKGRTVPEALTWGQAPVIAAGTCGGPQSIEVEVWLQINGVGGNFSFAGYSDLFSGGFDFAGENNSVKAASFSLNGAGPPPRRWDAGSALGGVGGTSYLWQGVSFVNGPETGISSQPGTPPPAAPDLAPNLWRIGTLSISLANASAIDAGPDGLFDVFLALTADWLSGPSEIYGSLAWGLDDQTETFPGDTVANIGRRSTRPELRIRACALIPQCGTCVGDVDGDNRVDGRDIQQFVRCYIGGNPNAAGCPCSDLDANATLNGVDLNQFVARLLGTSNPNPSCP